MRAGGTFLPSLTKGRFISPIIGNFLSDVTLLHPENPIINVNGITINKCVFNTGLDICNSWYHGYEPYRDEFFCMNNITFFCKMKDTFCCSACISIRGNRFIYTMTSIIYFNMFNPSEMVLKYKILSKNLSNIHSYKWISIR